MSLDDDIELAQQLLLERLSSDTKPTEKEARAAARRVLQAVNKVLHVSGQKNGLQYFIFCLASVLDPASIPEIARRAYTRKVEFTDTNTRAGRDDLRKHIEIAMLVRGLRARGTKNAVGVAAKKYGKTERQVFRICAEPDVKLAVASWCKGSDS